MWVKFSTGGGGTPSGGTIGGGDTAGNTLSFTVSFPATTADITSASITGLVAPATGATPVTVANLNPGATTYTVQSLSWSPAVSGTFDNNTPYTATIVLKATAGYKFVGAISPYTGGVGTPSAGTIEGGDIAGNTLSFEVSFLATTAEINAASITGLVAPATGATPVTAVDLNPGASTSYTVQSLEWSPIPSGTFAGGESYTAAIVLKATAGYKFTGSITPSTGGVGTPSAGTINGNTTENTLSFTVSFPATLVHIGLASVSGLVAPVMGNTPVGAGVLSSGDSSKYTVQSLNWSPTVSGTFAGNVSYKAVIEIKAAAGHKFTGPITPDTDAGTPASGTISGDVAENTLSFEVSFPVTATTGITAASVNGLAAKVTGNTPVTLAALSTGDSSKYTVQSLSWDPTPSGAFAGNVSYKAAIVLKAAAGYKFTGSITPSTGGVGTPAAGTTSGDAAENTLSFTVSFPATATTGISAASVNGLAAPVTGNTPVTLTALSAGHSSYTVQSITWSPTVSGAFAGNESYTAAIVLKAAAGYKFTGSITPSTDGVGTPAAGTTSGDAVENTLSFTVSFPATLVHIGSASISGLVVPVTGEPPVLAGTLSPGDSSKYTVQSLIWSPTVSGNFAGGESYTAAVVLKAAAGYKFTGSITPSTGGVGTPAAGTISGDAAENTLSFNVSFPPTANTGISIGDPSVKLYLNEGTMALEQNGSTPMGSAGAGIYTVKIAPDTYTGIKWYLNGDIVAQGATKTAITLSMKAAGTFKVTVEAEPQGGSKNTGTHTFIIAN